MIKDVNFVENQNKTLKYEPNNQKHDGDRSLRHSLTGNGGDS